MFNLFTSLSRFARFFRPAKLRPYTRRPQQPRHYRCILEQLEDRTTPSTLIAEPEFIEGNPTCAELCGADCQEFKIEAEDFASLQAGDSQTFSNADISVTLTVQADGGLIIDWEQISGTVSVHGVVMKAGSGANYYDYSGFDPAPTQDEGLVTPINDGGNQADISHIDFCYDTGEPPPGPIDIFGTKFNDLNGDGDISGDPAMTGTQFTISLYSWADDGDGEVQAGELSFLQSTETDATDGTWAFIGIEAGMYFVSEDGETGWTQTFGEDGYAIDGSAGGAAFGGKDFGNFLPPPPPAPIDIFGTKFNDLNGDGDITGDPAINDGVTTFTISLYGWADDGDGEVQAGELTFLQSTETDATDGTWAFIGIEAGMYFVSEDGETGWTQTFGNDGYAIDGSAGGAAFGGKDFGNFQNIQICGTKYEDLTGDGFSEDDLVLNSLNAHYVSVEIHLLDGDGNVVDTEFTDADGNYCFLGVGPGTYTVEEVTPSGWTKTDETGATIVATSGVDSDDNDFDNFKNIQICGTKYEDLTGDGFSEDDPVLNSLNAHYVSVEIHLLDADGNVVDTEFTDADGNYCFLGVGPGTYTVEEVTPSGWTKTDETGATIVATSGVDSDDNDFDNFKNICISGLKYYDANTNGVQDNGEVGIEGWRIQLKDADGNVVQTVSTGIGGAYSLGDLDGDGACDLGPGTWYVYEGVPIESDWRQSSPASVFFTVTVGGDEGQKSGVDATGRDFGNFCLGAGGGKTLGFWSNKNGEARMKDGGSLEPELQLLRDLPLKNANGTDFDPTTYKQFRTWLLSATATNMAYMLSAQLAAMALNVEAGFVSAGALVYAPGVVGGTDYITIDALVQAAKDQLTLDGYTPAGDPNRAIQEAIKNALDAANNNKSFVQAAPCPFTFLPLEEEEH